MKGIENPLPGIAHYPNEYGYRVVVWHYSADPMKDAEWARVARASEPDPAHWDQEMEISHETVRGRLTFYAFSEARNCIDSLPVSMEEFRSWTHFLSVDYGEGASPTAWLFWAEAPSKALYVYDSVYVHTEGRLAWPKEENNTGAISRVIYEKARHWFGISPSAPMDLHAHIKYAIGDPSGRGLANEYANSAYPIHIGDASGLPKNVPKVNDMAAGEERVNLYLSPAFLCCRGPDGRRLPVFAEVGQCPVCNAERQGSPRLRILRPNCPELITQLKTVRKKQSSQPGMEPSTRDMALPNHATDALKYGAMTRSPEALAAEAALPTEAPRGSANSLNRYISDYLKDLEYQQREDARGGAGIWETGYAPAGRTPYQLQ